MLRLMRAALAAVVVAPSPPPKVAFWVTIRCVGTLAEGFRAAVVALRASWHDRYAAQTGADP
jgi:hypothetical protein